MSTYIVEGISPENKRERREFVCANRVELIAKLHAWVSVTMIKLVEPNPNASTTQAFPKGRWS